MPIYLVRWPDLSASFVQAEGEAHLLDILDQVGNPDEIARKQQSVGGDVETLRQDKPSTNPPLFRISNHHTEDCGQPPAIDGDGEGKYVGYFANRYGEQAVFVYDYATREASVWMGETGWGKAYRVVDGRTEGILLTESEATWIRACWLAAAKGD